MGPLQIQSREGPVPMAEATRHHPNPLPFIEQLVVFAVQGAAPACSLPGRRSGKDRRAPTRNWKS